MTPTGAGRLAGGKIEQKEKRTHGHGQQSGDCGGEWVIRGLNVNAKIYKKYIILNEN